MRRAIAALLLTLSLPILPAGPIRAVGPSEMGGVIPHPPATAPAVSVEDVMAGFSQWYEPVVFQVLPQIPPVALPLRRDQLDDSGPVLGTFGLDNAEFERLLRDGFVVVDLGPHSDVAGFYDMVEDRNWPVLVTADALLHLHHIQFAETLRGIEERFFIPDLQALCASLNQDLAALMGATAGRAQAAAELAALHLSVASQLLQGVEVAEGAPGEEIAQILAHEGPGLSPLFGYQENYSQYVPRGHYTRSPGLERYFRAMMWLGRMTFLIKGADPAAGVTGLVDLETARTHTAAALLLADRLRRVTLPDGRTAQQVWDRMYRITSFYAGASDDLSPADYAQALGPALIGWSTGDVLTPELLNDDAWIDATRGQLAALRPPRIYSGTGNQSTGVSGEASLLAVLGETQGMRVMGQRSVPDSEIMQRLVFPAVGAYTGPDAVTPFTLVRSDLGPIRAFPRGLDVMSVFGSQRAARHLSTMGDASYEGYAEAVAELRLEFARLTPIDWNRNLYWSWLHALQALFGPHGHGYPVFMQSEAWLDRRLETALASWTALRHDTILYAKQSETPMATAAPPMELPQVVGYVEPVPELYARLLATSRMTRRGLEAMGVLESGARWRLEYLETILERLLDISVRELQNVPLTAEDYEFIDHFAAGVESTVGDVDPEGLQTTLVADVHTDGNTGSVLEEGSGYLNAVVAAYPNPRGQLVLGVGAVLTHREFRHPQSDRLTDEAWRAMLERGELPAPAPWQRPE